MSGRATPRASSPRGGSRTPRGPLRQTKQLNAQPRVKKTDPKPSPFHALPLSSAEEAEAAQQDEAEAALAAVLLQEALRGTPRYRPSASADAPRHQPIVLTPPKQLDDEEDVEEDIPLIPERLMARRRLKDSEEAQWMYLVRFRGLGKEDDHWVPENDLDPAFIAAELAAAEAERHEAVE